MMMNAAGEELLRRDVYTQKLLRAEEAFTHCETQGLLHREVFTQSGS